MSWYQKTTEETLAELRVFDFAQGLTEREVNLRLEKYGLNKLETRAVESSWRIFFRQFKSSLTYILLIAGLLTVLLQDLTDSAIIFFTLFLNVFIGFFQERRMARELEALQQAFSEKATVIRGGVEKEIAAEKVVPGDILVLKLGDKISADARIVKSHYLKTNEAVLTGEWQGQDKKSEIINKDNLALGDQSNMVFAGTFVEEGKGLAVVVATGPETQIGQIAGYVREVKKEKTVFEKRILHLSRFLGIFTGAASLVIVIFGLLTGKNLLEMFLTGVAVAVSSVPEGLPVAITVILIVGAKKILQKKGLVRRLRSVETLGSTTIICTDKTGTLTEGKMQVVKILTGTRELLRDENGFQEKIDNDGDESHITLLKIATLANEATIENPEDELSAWRIHGRATDIALLTAGTAAGIDKQKLEREYQKIDELPFDSSRKYYLGLYDTNSHNVLFSLGAPEILIAKSQQLDLDGQSVPLDEKRKQQLLDSVAALGRQGLRVLGVAKREFPQREIKKIEGSLDNPDLHLVFVGLVGLRDPLRKDVKHNIQVAREAGLRVVMVTGDHTDTAQAVAREIGLRFEPEEVLTGQEISSLKEEDLNRAVQKVKIFARVDPKDKLRIVRALQRQEHVVAMTGDGVNDTPALKRADIGLALGSGTDAARAVADLVMLNDSFSIIVAAIKQGRVILDNIKKTLTYLLADSFSEMLLIMGSIILGLPLPILPAQILWVNLVSDALPAMSLVFEKPEGDVMKRRPQGKKTRLFDGEIKFLVFIIGVVTDLLLFAIFWWYFKESHNIEYIRTVIFAALGLDSLFYIFACKSLRQNIWRINVFNNRYLLGAVLIGLVVLVAGIYIPFLQTLLKTQSLALFDWGLVAVFSLINIVLIELGKFIFIRLKRV